jgi:diamine N-acetyltransferase
MIIKDEFYATSSERHTSILKLWRIKMAIRFTEVSRDNWEECIGLSVSDEQEDFVASNCESILLSKFEEDCYPLCIYNDDDMVGFLMYDIDPETKRWELSRLMIDEVHQGNGYGKQALSLLLKQLKEKLGSIQFYTSVEPANEVMKKLIKSLGFSETGEIMWDEEIYCINL